MFLARIPIQSYSKLSITQKRQNKAKYLIWNSIRLKFVRRPVCETQLKALVTSSATTWVAPDLLQAIAILSDTWNTIKTKHFWQIKVSYDLFNQLSSYRNIMQFQISSRRKTGKEILESSRLKYLEKFLAKKKYLQNVE